ncbi:MAG: carboxypeptidase-like regulatory domain-containing protein [Ferruginibacter sp.]
MEERKNIIYTAADLQRYHSGAMSDSEMNALEKAALEDPFLSDALEGYAFTATAEKDTIELKKRLEQKEEKKKGFVLFNIKNRAWLSAAALLVLILGTIYFTLKLNNKKEDVMLAKKEDSKQEPVLEKKDSGFTAQNEQTFKPVPIPTDTLKEKLNQALANVRLGAETKKTNASSYTYSVPLNSNATAISKVPDYYKTDGYHVSDSLSVREKNTWLVPTSPTLADVKPAKKETGYRDEAVDEAALKERIPLENNDLKSSKYLFSGKVVDQNGNPVAFATVNDSLKKSITTTDANGRFSISDNDSSIYASISAVGYNKLNQGLRSSHDQTIVLSRNSQELSEVVVTSMGAVRQKASVGYSTTTIHGNGTVPGITVTSGSEPVIGKLKYNQDFIDSIKNSLTVNKKLTKGSVILSFKIKRNGEVKSIRVEKKLCDACEEEAIRLLREGAKWKYVNDKRTNITITF